MRQESLLVKLELTVNFTQVADPSTFKSTLVHHADTPLRRYVDVRFASIPRYLLKS
jgi:hypothetical protein